SQELPEGTVTVLFTDLVGSTDLTTSRGDEAAQEILRAQRDLTDENGIGWMTGQQWQALHDYLVEFGGIPAPLDDVSVTYDDQFVKGVYEGS
ncbi:MAG: hypothetical protein V3V35_01165, partial [Dehalococcoidia bacterium]